MAEKHYLDYGGLQSYHSQLTAKVTSEIAEATKDLAESTSLNEFYNNVEYNKEAKKIVFTTKNNQTKEIDASDFIKDGMVNTVTIADGTEDNLGKKVLKITFNTDSGKEAIEIDLTQIFNAENYYDKDTADSTFLNANTQFVSIKVGNTDAKPVKGSSDTIEITAQGLGALTEHQSLDDYLKSEEAETTYVKITDVITTAEINALFE